MTLNTTYAAYQDAQLRARVDAAVWQEAFTQGLDNDYANLVMRGAAGGFTSFYWRVAIDYTAAYETAVNTGRGAPGYDTDIITDANIAAAVAAAWPPDPEPEP